MAGFAKLSGQPMMVETFDKIGIGQSFRFVTGGIEVVSAVLLFIPSLTAVGAALLLHDDRRGLTHLALSADRLWQPSFWAASPRSSCLAGSQP